MKPNSIQHEGSEYGCKPGEIMRNGTRVRSMTSNWSAQYTEAASPSWRLPGSGAGAEQMQRTVIVLRQIRDGSVKDWDAEHISRD